MIKTKRKTHAPDLGTPADPNLPEPYDFTDDELAELDEAGDDLFLVTPASMPAPRAAYVPGRSDISALRRK